MCGDQDKAAAVVAVSWAEGSRCAVFAAIGRWRRQRPSSERTRRGYRASSSLCVGDATAEPPAHCRLDPATILAGGWPQTIVQPCCRSGSSVERNLTTQNFSSSRLARERPDDRRHKVVPASHIISGFSNARRTNYMDILWVPLRLLSAHIAHLPALIPPMIAHGSNIDET